MVRLWVAGAGELTSYGNSSDDMTSATYNGDGLRTSTTTGDDGTQYYTWNTLAGVPQLLTDGTNAYIYATGTAPAEQVNLSSGTVTYLITDSLGSVRGTINSSGSLTATCTYDAYGNSLTTRGITSTTPFGYAGYYTDTTGLDYLINRYYDPASGQYLSEDALLIQTDEPYEYANGDPISNTDPQGLSWAHISVGFIWAQVKFNKKATAFIASLLTREEGWLFIADDIIGDEELGPVGDYIADWVNDNILKGEEEARRIAGDTAAERAVYLARNNMRCHEWNVGIAYYWGIPYVYSFWGSYFNRSLCS